MFSDTHNKTHDVPTIIYSETINDGITSCMLKYIPFVTVCAFQGSCLPEGILYRERLSEAVRVSASLAYLDTSHKDYASPETAPP